LEALGEAAYYYGIAIANAILTTQADVVVCGGTLTPKNHFFEMTKKSIEEKLAIFPHIKTRIYPANDSYEIVAQGAGGMVMEKYLAD
ncbi:ROK family protein, partial [Escherichia coli]|nr:ROK family protein [Escherichia coli]